MVLSVAESLDIWQFEAMSFSYLTREVLQATTPPCIVELGVDIEGNGFFITGAIKRCLKIHCKVVKVKFLLWLALLPSLMFLYTCSNSDSYWTATVGNAMHWHSVSS